MQLGQAGRDAVGGDIADVRDEQAVRAVDIVHGIGVEDPLEVDGAEPASEAVLEVPDPPLAVDLTQHDVGGAVLITGQLGEVPVPVDFGPDACLDAHHDLARGEGGQFGSRQFGSGQFGSGCGRLLGRGLCGVGCLVRAPCVRCVVGCGILGGFVGCVLGGFARC